MRTLALNKLSAKSAKNAGDGLHSDGGGLFLQVRGNSRSWMFRFTEAGKKKSMGLGPVTSITLAKARELATKAREALAMGDDPRGVKAAAVSVNPGAKRVRFPERYWPVFGFNRALARVLFI